MGLLIDDFNGFREPLKPIDAATRMSRTPLFFNSVITDSQNLAPSSCAIHNPKRQGKIANVF